MDRILNGILPLVNSETTILHMWQIANDKLDNAELDWEMEVIIIYWLLLRLRFRIESSMKLWESFNRETKMGVFKKLTG